MPLHPYIQITKKQGGLIAGVALLFLLSGLAIPPLKPGGWFAGYALGLLAVLLHFIMSGLMKHVSPQKMMMFYFGGMVARFLLIIALFILFLISEKFDQLSFTVSFLISYLCHSFIDLMSIRSTSKNRLQSTTNKKH